MCVTQMCVRLVEGMVLSEPVATVGPARRFGVECIADGLLAGVKEVAVTADNTPAI